MARQRRGGGFKPPELRGTLGTLLRTAAAQVGPLREALTDAASAALERTAREGRSRLDDVRARYAATPSSPSSRPRRGTSDRDAALAELGEIVLDLIRRGEIDIAELPEVADVVAHLDALDDDADADLQAAVRSPRNSYSDGGGDDDGTVSSRTWSTPSGRARPPASARPAVKPAPRVWRPPADHDDAPDSDHSDSDRTDAGSGPVVTSHRRPPPNPLKKGGISFDDDDDDDLAEYMHPDDVPTKPSDGDS